jgi:hypothetical protein
VYRERIANVIARGEVITPRTKGLEWGTGGRRRRATLDVLSSNRLPLVPVGILLLGLHNERSSVRERENFRGNEFETHLVVRHLGQVDVCKYTPDQ